MSSDHQSTDTNLHYNVKQSVLITDEHGWEQREAGRSARNDAQQFYGFTSGKCSAMFPSPAPTRS